MNEPNVILKSRLSEVLETLNLIILLYAMFLVVLGVIIHNSEVILQTCIMFVVYIISEYINYDVIKITNKGIYCEKYKFLAWQDMYVVKKKNRIITIYTKNRKKPYKFIVKKSEDKMELERGYKYIISKVKAPEKIKEEIINE